MDNGDRIRFRVESEEFTEIASTEHSKEDIVSSEQTSTSPYVLTASIKEDGLGCCDWWVEEEDEEEEE